MFTLPNYKFKLNKSAWALMEVQGWLEADIFYDDMNWKLEKFV